jgi:glycosyltransferase involved in cell wall biosynthesis
MSRTRKKIAILRGKNLNKWDMQMYEPLLEDFEMVAFKPPRNRFDVQALKLPLHELSDGENMLRELAHPIGTIKRIRKYGGYGNHFYFELLRRKLAGYDVVHVAETYTNYANTAACLKPSLGYKLVTTVWENIPFKFMDSPGELRSRPHIVPMIDKFIAVSELAKKALLTENILEDKIEVIYPGIDTALFKPAGPDLELLQKLGCRRDDFLMLIAGQINQKGIYELLEAARMLKANENSKRFKCVVVGALKNSKTFEKLIGMYGLWGKFVIAGHVLYQDLPRFYNSVDVLILPSTEEKDWQEQFGTMFAEVMACKKPVISMHCGAIPEIVGKGGLFAIPGDSQSLYELLTRVMSDARLRIKLAENGYKRAMEHFDARRQSEKIKNVYLEVMDEKPTVKSYAKKFSVVIPVYNRANIIGEALRSIKEQASINPEDIEIICIDDGSTDELERALAGFPEVRVIKIKHRGLIGLVRNEGLKAARGEIIAYLDSDDRWKPNHLKTIWREFEKDRQLCFVATRAEYEHVEITADHLKVLKKGRPKHKSALITDCVAHKKLCVDELGGFGDADFAEDRYLWNKIMLNYPFKRLKKVTAVFRYLKAGNNVSYRFDHLKKKYYE